MTYCKQIPLPVLEADIEKIKFFYKNGYKLFNERQIDNPYWMLSSDNEFEVIQH